jgi:hypothetical protein
MTSDINIHSTPEHDAATTPMSDLEHGNVSPKEVVAEKKHIRTGDKSNEVLVLPKNRLVIVFIGLMLTVFLAALDTTIVCMNPPPFIDDSIFINSDCFAYHCTGFTRG